MKKLVVIALFGILAGSAYGQEVSFGADLFSRYIWRGIDLSGNSPSIQPWATLKAGNTDHTFSLGVWSAFSLANSTNEEIDLSACYTFKNLVGLTVTDYFFPGLNSGSKNDYFQWNPDSTGHVLEGTVSFVGSEKLPVTALFAVNLYGNDARKSNGHIFMSKYLELGYKLKYNGTDINLFIGAALDNPDENKKETSFYLNKKIGVTNIGLKLSKSIQLTEKFALPVQCALSCNPDLGKIYLAFGISL